MGEVTKEHRPDPAMLLLQIATLPDHAARMEAWQRLPFVLRRAITTLMQDVVLDTALQLRESGAQYDLDDQDEATMP
jgi:hypothetical protein